MPDKITCVGDLIRLLSQFDPDLPVALNYEDAVYEYEECLLVDTITYFGNGVPRGFVTGED